MDTNAFREREAQRRTGFKIIYDFVMGIIWVGAGVFFILSKQLDTVNFGFDPLMASIFGIACICYGSFRLYRGFAAKKQP